MRVPAAATVDRKCTATSRANPFSTRFIRAGEIPFQFTKPMDLNTIVQNFLQSQSVGQIVGPHGCGKTTLTRMIEAQLMHSADGNSETTIFSSVRRVVIRRLGQFARPVELEMVLGDIRPASTSGNFFSATQCLFVIDGVERLSLLQRRLLINGLRHRSGGVLLTSHRRIRGIPVVATIRPTLPVFRQIVDRLSIGITVDEDILQQAYQQSQGNIREALMALYDWVELRDGENETNRIFSVGP